MGFDYRSTDTSSRSDSRLSFASRTVPWGTCVHTTSGSDSLSYLQGGVIKEGRFASADYLIARDGSRFKITPEGRRPYHAGISRLVYANRLYQGDEVSAVLLGVELECLDSQYCTYQQHDSLAELVVERGLAYGWRWPYYLVGHYELALPVGRRSDPLGFLWGDFMGRLYIRAQAANVAGLG